MSITLNGTSGIASPGGDTNTSLTTSTITTSGNVGIGGSPSERLSVTAGSGSFSIAPSATAGYSTTVSMGDAGVVFNTNSSIRGYGFQVNGASRFLINSDGGIYTGTGSASPYNKTTANAANMYVDTNGALYRSTSSLKYKTDVQDAVHGLADLLKLRPVTYKGKSDSDADKVFGGLIAEEVDAAGLTEFVQYAEDNTPDALAYGNMVALCIKAIQEQQAQIETLTAKVAALEAK